MHTKYKVVCVWVLLLFFICIIYIYFSVTLIGVEFIEFIWLIYSTESSELVCAEKEFSSGGFTVK